MRKTIALLALASCLPAAATDFTYNFKGLEPTGYKLSGKAETVEVAIHLDNEVFIGKTITGFSVPVLGDASLYSEFSGFITTELKTKTVSGNKVNLADVCTVDAEPAEGMLTVTFPEPYVITEKGAYVGYSLSVPTGADVKNDSPVAVVAGGTEGSFNFRASRSHMNWKDLSVADNVSSAMTVFLSGDFPTNAMGSALPQPIYMEVNKEGDVNVSVSNWGINHIESFSYEYTAGDSKSQGTVQLDSPIPAVVGFVEEITLPLEPMDTEGTFDCGLTITEVNGEKNEYPAPTATSIVKVLDFMPACRPLVEEYTGLNCGYCPRGYVTLKEMTEEYGHEKFVAIAYHSGFERGCMVCLDEYPYYPSGYPAAQIDRASIPDVGSIASRWAKAREKMPAGDVEVKFAFDDETGTTLTATCTARFVEDLDNAGYRLAYVLVADGLSDPEWSQYNVFSYADKVSEDMTGKWWDLFAGTSLNVFGLEFDDVAVYAEGINGIPGSLPEYIKKGESYSGTFKINTEDVVNENGEHIVKDFGKTRAIAIILDKNGKVVNCASSPYPTASSAVNGIADGESVSTRYYDLQGRPCEKTKSGIMIRVETLSDGTTRAAKVIL